jgi:hypothetical protein
LANPRDCQIEEEASPLVHTSHGFSDRADWSPPWASDGEAEGRGSHG